jgi:hypothetical protein
MNKQKSRGGERKTAHGRETAIMDAVSATCYVAIRQAYIAETLPSVPAPKRGVAYSGNKPKSTKSTGAVTAGPDSAPRQDDDATVTGAPLGRPDQSMSDQDEERA